MNRFEFSKKLENYTGIVNSGILANLDSSKEDTLKAVRYALTEENNEKRYMGLYRSKIVFCSGKIYGFRPKDTLDAAVGIEYIHTSSLILDDMPFMDNATMRRGKRCTHLEFGEDIAALAAHYLLTKGSSLILKNAQNFKRYPAISAELDETLGIEGLVGGQETDLKGYSNKTTITKGYFKKNRLMNFSLVFPSLLNNGKHFKELSAIGKNMCIAYQIHDDLRDKCSSKFSGKDEKKHSFKLTDIINKTKLKNKRNMLIKQSIKKLNMMPKADELIMLLNYIFFERN